MYFKIHLKNYWMIEINIFSLKKVKKYSGLILKKIIISKIWIYYFITNTYLIYDFRKTSSI
jgi:hypothetical protein